MTKPHQTCAAPSCAAEAGSRAPFCERHWDVLPGKLRSRIDITTSGRSAERAENINRAVRLIGMMA